MANKFAVCDKPNQYFGIFFLDFHKEERKDIALYNSMSYNI